MKLFTLGYQGLSLKRYIDLLHQHGVSALIDIRETPWSHKQDFVKHRLQSELNRAGIKYVHQRSAGNPSQIRKTSSSVDECLERYDDHLSNNEDIVIELMFLLELHEEIGMDSCLMCFEKSHDACHRSIIIDHLQQLIPNLDVCHIIDEPTY